MLTSMFISVTILYLYNYILVKTESKALNLTKHRSFYIKKPNMLLIYESVCKNAQLGTGKPVRCPTAENPRAILDSGIFDG